MKFRTYAKKETLALCLYCLLVIKNTSLVKFQLVICLFVLHDIFRRFFNASAMI